jgi:hypothetical protein
MTGKERTCLPAGARIAALARFSTSIRSPSIVEVLAHAVRMRLEAGAGRLSQVHANMGRQAIAAQIFSVSTQTSCFHLLVGSLTER